MAGVTFRDETATGRPVAAAFGADGLPERMTVRELIRLRVREEVARYHADPGSHFRGLVRPEAAEADLNGYRMPEPRRLDWHRQAAVAERAFLSNGFFVLVGDRQVEELEEVVELGEGTEVVFVRLVALAGG
ncbi:hypothetical protein GCM10010329_26110 [Streptomyces spiroverticillatus]|uniref:Uncharacterized protein n=1 Tax=Streptomyces finlayi TaxID=67296 RepID=A0A919C959_9ACTN|nr:hypothetical protein [Streptomyces finlayi]GHA02801.1 hypothetical protein GCM10010329_26110 [Streptomyces spiroverticillatus]GHC87037.1 hypothetical protein GCM10010334_18520 [Streptomyces finlayi]